VKWAWDIFEGEDVGLVGVFVAVVGSVPWFLGGGGEVGISNCGCAC